MAEKRNNHSLKENMCSICYGKCKLKFRQEIEKEIMVKIKPQSSSVIYDPFASKWCVTKNSTCIKNRDEIHDDIFRKILKEEILGVIKEIISEKLFSIYKEKYADNKCRWEILDLKSKQFATDDKIINLEMAIDYYKNKYQEINDKLEHIKNIEKHNSNSYQEMKSIMEDKLQHIKNIDEQYSELQRGFYQLNQCLNLVEHDLKHANMKLKNVQLGQQLNVDFTTPPRLYNTDFQVRDHKMSGGVWLYNNRDNNSNVDGGLGASTEYFTTESPGKSTALTGFQMAPGGERRKSTTEAPKDSVDDLQRRLDKLRGFNL